MANYFDAGSPKKAPIQYSAGKAEQEAPRTPAPTYKPPRKSSSSSKSAAPAPAAPAAPAYTAVAAPAATTAAAPAAAPSYPWLDQAFSKYFGQVQQDYADRGLLDSTNKIEPMKELADAYTARYAQEARTDNQNAVQNAMSLWEMLASGALQQGQLALGAGLSPTINMPAQPGIFSNVFNQSYLPPLKGTGPTGDAPVVSRPLGVDTQRGEVIPTYGMTYDNVKYRDEKAAVDRNAAIQQAYLKLAQDSAAKEDAASDPWAQMAADAVQNKLAGKAAPGSNLFPTDLIESYRAAYGIDIEALVKQGDPRAIALVKSMYDDPAYSDAVIARMQGIPTVRPVSNTAPASATSSPHGNRTQFLSEDTDTPGKNDFAKGMNAILSFFNRQF